MSSDSSGKHTPYWYESSVGLLKIIEMLNPESQIDSVSLQKTGVKGWDDVVVERSGKLPNQYFQVKHTRANDTLSFGDIVGSSVNNPSLIQHLFEGWCQMKLGDEGAECVIYSNRKASNRKSTADKVTRPPLRILLKWIKKAKGSEIQNLSKIPIEAEYNAAWKELQNQLVDPKTQKKAKASE